jgi:pimeloyl-ACP methyl ester carboxylesterase
MSETMLRDGITFAYETSGAGTPLVLLHGLGGDRSGAMDLCGDLPGWARVVFDQRGHGETCPVGPEEGYSFDELADDAAALVEHMNARRVALAGVSMGAAVALRFALRHPDRVLGLALVRPAWINRPMTENLTPNVEVARLLRSLPAEEGLLAFRRSPLFLRISAASPHAAESLSSQFLRPGAAERAVRLDRMPRSTPYRDPADLGSITQPTLVVGCDRDPLHPIEFARAWADLIPRSSLELVVSSADDIARHRQAVRASVESFVRQLAHTASSSP